TRGRRPPPGADGLGRYPLRLDPRHDDFSTQSDGFVRNVSKTAVDGDGALASPSNFRSYTAAISTPATSITRNNGSITTPVVPRNSIARSISEKLGFPPSSSNNRPA